MKYVVKVFPYLLSIFRHLRIRILATLWVVFSSSSWALRPFSLLLPLKGQVPRCSLRCGFGWLHWRPFQRATGQLHFFIFCKYFIWYCIYRSLKLTHLEPTDATMEKLVKLWLQDSRGLVIHVEKHFWWQFVDYSLKKMISGLFSIDDKGSVLSRVIPLMASTSLQSQFFINGDIGVWERSELDMMKYWFSHIYMCDGNRVE